MPVLSIWFRFKSLKQPGHNICFGGWKVGRDKKQIVAT